MPGRQRPMRRNGQQDPETARGSASGPLPFPAPRLSAGRQSLSRLPYGANGAVLTGTASPQKPTQSLEGGMGALWNWVTITKSARRSGPLVGSEISGRSQEFFTFSLTADGLLIEGAETRRRTRRR